MMDTTRFVDDESPLTRKLCAEITTDIHSFGNTGLDRDREAFSPGEIALAERIGLDPENE